EPDHVLEADRFAAAGSAQDRSRLALADRQVDAAQHRLAVERLVDSRELDHEAVGPAPQRITSSWVRKKSVTSTPIDAARTVRVVARPTPTVPPVVWSAVEHPTIAISQPNTNVLRIPENMSWRWTVLSTVCR